MKIRDLQVNPPSSKGIKSKIKQQKGFTLQNPIQTKNNHTNLHDKAFHG